MSKVAALRAMREAKHNTDFPIKTGMVEPLSGPNQFHGEFGEAREFIDIKPINEAAKTLGSKGGKSKSPAKAQAAKLNGKKGGRPKAQTKAKRLG